MKFFILLILIFLNCCAAGQRAAFRPAYEEDLQSAKRLIQNGQRRQAIDELSMLIEMNPKDEKPRFLRALAYQGLEEYTLAIEDYEKILEKKQDHAKAHYNLGMIYAFKLNDSKKALEHLDEFLSLEPAHPESYSVAKIICSLDSPSFSQDKTSSDPLSSLEKIYETADRDERIKKLQEVASHTSDSPLPHYFLAKSLEEAGEEGEAIHSYRKAIEIRPSCVPCHTLLGELLIRKNKKKEGELHLMKARLFGPGREIE